MKEADRSMIKIALTATSTWAAIIHVFMSCVRADATFIEKMDEQRVLIRMEHIMLPEAANIGLARNPDRLDAEVLRMAERHREQDRRFTDRISKMFDNIIFQIVLSENSALLNPYDPEYDIPLPVLGVVRTPANVRERITSDILTYTLGAENRPSGCGVAFFNILEKICMKRLGLLVRSYLIDGVMREKIRAGLRNMKGEVLGGGIAERARGIPGDEFFCLSVANIILEERYVNGLILHLSRGLSDYHRHLKRRDIRLTQEHPDGDKIARLLSVVRKRAVSAAFDREIYAIISKYYTAVAESLLADNFDLCKHMLFRRVHLRSQIRRRLEHSKRGSFHHCRYYSLNISMWALNIHYLLLNYGDPCPPGDTFPPSEGAAQAATAESPSQNGLNGPRIQSILNDRVDRHVLAVREYIDAHRGMLFWALYARSTQGTSAAQEELKVLGKILSLINRIVLIRATQKKYSRDHQIPPGLFRLPIDFVGRDMGVITVGAEWHVA